MNLGSMLELHDRVRADLDRRDAAAVEREREARELLERTIAECTSERAAIAQERVVLHQAEQLYRKFLASNVVPLAVVSVQPQQTVVKEEPAELPPAPVETIEPEQPVIEVAAAAPAEIVPPEPVQLSEPEPEPEFESRIRELRSDLVSQIIAEDKGEEKAPKWSPLRGLLRSA